MDYYSILGVNKNASDTELKKAYKDLRAGYDEMKNLVFELSKKQKEINGNNTKQFRNLRKRLS